MVILIVASEGLILCAAGTFQLLVRLILKIHFSRGNPLEASTRSYRLRGGRKDEQMLQGFQSLG